jgi:lipopolysaccharide/colanic/teichoic acid biosynthesis glycosyltransferase
MSQNLCRRHTAILGSSAPPRDKADHEGTTYLEFANSRSYTRPLPPKSAKNANADCMNSNVLSEPQFRAALRWERRRTERSERPFLLVLASLGMVTANDCKTASLENLASALAASFRETDIIGWHRQDGVLGAIFTELGTSDTSAIRTAIEKRVLAVMDERPIANHREEITLTFHFFPDDSKHEEHSVRRLRAEVYGEQQSKPVAQAVKRIIDVTGSVAALILLSPALLAISLLIKLTSEGPVLFRQSRIGQHGREFTFLKFRSMYANTDAALHKEYVSHFIAGKAQMRESADGKTSAYKVIDDPRITPLGRFLRRMSLDELPQLINVLKGELSLVGPRPPLPYEFACYHLWHRRRVVEVRPGITGLWQVDGRSRTSFDEMVRLDLRYATRWSLWLDFVILLRTPGAVLSGDGAH